MTALVPPQIPRPLMPFTPFHTHDLLPTPSLPTSTPAPILPDSTRPSQGSPLLPPSTPPPTPVSDSPTPESLSSPTMFELTRSKLERAAQGQSSGRRGAPSLRQMVLLSNIFGTSQWLQQEMESLELDRRRKEDEEAWLDGVLEEMLVDESLEGEEDTSEDSTYVEVSFRDRYFGDSGYLEREEERERKGNPLVRIEEEPHYRDQVDEYDAADDEEEGIRSPYTTSPPSPSKSPPLEIPGRSPRPHPYLSTSAFHPVDAEHLDTFSTSPPLFPPSLTPDCSPPGEGASANLLGTSVDSLDSDFDPHPSDWIERTAPSLQVPEPVLSEYLAPLSMVIYSDIPSFESLSIGPFPPPRSPPTRDSLSLALIRQAPNHWTPRPPRSLSLPSTSRPRPRHPVVPPTSIYPDVVSIYDAIDFGPSYRAHRSIAASTTIEGDDRGREDSLAMVLRPPLPSHQLRRDESGRQVWRSRSLSPQSTSNLSATRRGWVQSIEHGDIED